MEKTLLNLHRQAFMSLWKSHRVFSRCPHLQWQKCGGSDRGEFWARTNTRITIFPCIGSSRVWKKVFDDGSKFSSVSLHDSPKVLSGLLSIKLGLIETIRIVHSTQKQRFVPFAVFPLFCFHFFFWQAPGACYSFPKLHFIALLQFKVTVGVLCARAVHPFPCSVKKSFMLLI